MFSAFFVSNRKLMKKRIVLRGMTVEEAFTKPGRKIKQ